jgi:hypothetical protein
MNEGSGAARRASRVRLIAARNRLFAAPNYFPKGSMLAFGKTPERARRTDIHGTSPHSLRQPEQCSRRTANTPMSRHRRGGSILGFRIFSFPRRLRTAQPGEQQDNRRTRQQQRPRHRRQDEDEVLPRALLGIFLAGRPQLVAALLRVCFRGCTRGLGFRRCPMSRQFSRVRGLRRRRRLLAGGSRPLDFPRQVRRGC